MLRLPWLTILGVTAVLTLASPFVAHAVERTPPPADSWPLPPPWWAVNPPPPPPPGACPNAPGCVLPAPVIVVPPAPETFAALPDGPAPVKTGSPLGVATVVPTTAVPVWPESGKKAGW